MHWPSPRSICRARAAGAAFLLLGLAAPAAAYEGEVRTLCSELAEKIAQSGRSSVGVADFTDVSGNVTELGRFLAEEFAIELGSSGKGFRVIDRNHLATLLKEHKLSATGLIDPQAARRLGKIAGVEVIVTGFLTPFGDSVRVTVKALDTDTAAMLGSARGSIPKSGTIEELLGRGIAGGDSATGGDGGGAAAPARKGSSPTQTAVVQDIVYELQQCTLAAEAVTCEMLIQNNSKTRELRIYGYSALIDDHGNEYKLWRVNMANNLHELRGYRVAEKVLPYGITVRAELTFTGILPEATRITSLTLLCDADRSDWERVEFRDIALDEPEVPAIGKLSPGAGQPHDGDQGEGSGEGQDSTLADEIEGTATDVAKQTLRKWRDKLLDKVPDP